MRRRPKYDLTAAGQSLGSETFEITACQTALLRHRTNSAVLAAATIDLTTNLELGADLLPRQRIGEGHRSGPAVRPDRNVPERNGDADHQRQCAVGAVQAGRVVAGRQHLLPERVHCGTI